MCFSVMHATACERENGRETLFYIQAENVLIVWSGAQAYFQCQLAVRVGTLS